MAKTIKCSDTTPQGGCDASFTADTPEDAKAQLTAHARESHADMMAKATPEDITKWNANFDNNVWPNAASN